MKPEPVTTIRFTAQAERVTTIRFAQSLERREWEAACARTDEATTQRGVCLQDEEAAWVRWVQAGRPS